MDTSRENSLLQTMRVPIGDLTPDPHNARRHPEENLQAIQDSLERFGQVLPLVIREGIVVGGNGTLEAMKRLGFESVKVIPFQGSEEEARALAIALNRTAELATWDEDALGESLVALATEGYNHEALGFSDEALEKMFPEVREETFRIAMPDIEKEAKEAPKAIVQYALIFEDEDQQRRFFLLSRRLKDLYDHGTEAARLVAFLEDHIGDV